MEKYNFFLVLTHCQVKSIPSIMYILATEALHFDVTAVKSFAPILGEDILSGIRKVCFSSIKILNILKLLAVCFRNSTHFGILFYEEAFHISNNFFIV